LQELILFPIRKRSTSMFKLWFSLFVIMLFNECNDVIYVCCKRIFNYLSFQSFD